MTDDRRRDEEMCGWSSGGVECNAIAVGPEQVIFSTGCKGSQLRVECVHWGLLSIESVRLGV